MNQRHNYSDSIKLTAIDLIKNLDNFLADSNWFVKDKEKPTVSTIEKIKRKKNVKILNKLNWISNK